MPSARPLALVALITLVAGASGCNDGGGGGGGGAPLPTATATNPATTVTFTLSPTPTQSSQPSQTRTPTPSRTATTTSQPTVTATMPAGVAIRAVPYDVGNNSGLGQRTMYNSHRGGGSVGMPVGFGDIDGDGHGDFVGCPMLSDSGPGRVRTNSGEVHVYYGDGTISGVVVNTEQHDAITTFMGARAGDILGTHVFVGDFNKDSYSDVLMGAQNSDGAAADRRNAGAAFLYFGRPDRPRHVDLAAPPAGVVAVYGEEPGDRLGVWVWGGDVDGDGWLDLLIGADQADGPANARPDTGAVYVIFGGQELPAAIDMANPGELRVAVLHGIDPGDHFGCTIHAADVNEDGADDLLISGGLARGSSQIEGTFLAGGDGPDNQRTDAGEVYLLFSGASDFPPVTDLATAPAEDRLTIYGANVRHLVGEELGTGDLDGDGRIDLALGALLATGPAGSRGSSTGRAYIVFDALSRRGQTLDLASPGVGVTVIFGRRPGTISGDTLIVADMDGDGFDDLWDAAPNEGTRTLDGVFRSASGVLDILFGQPQWPAMIDLLVLPNGVRHVQIRGTDRNDQFSYGLAVGDADADGTLDVIANGMGGDGFENRVLDAGEIYVVANQNLFDTSATEAAPLYLNIDIQPVLQAACVPCHAPPSPQGDLRLDIIQNSITDLLGSGGEGRQSTQVDDLLVVPGDPAASYLMEKLEATAESPARVGDRMPPPPANPLPHGVVAEVRRWIEAGARIANESLPPPPPPTAPPADGFSATFSTSMRFVLSDEALGEIETVLLDPPAPVPLRLIGPRLTVPAAEWETVTLPSDFGDVDIELNENGEGTIDRASGEIELSITFIQIALAGANVTVLPVVLTTGEQNAGPFVTQGQPLNFADGALKLAGIGQIPSDTPIVGGDFVLVELEGNVSPLVPAVPTLADEIQPILSQSCALANCHIGDGAAELNLEPQRAYGELVEGPSTQVDDLLVVPGSIEQSYLWEKITLDQPRVGDRMPIGNALDALDTEAIRQWILGGAPQ